MGKTDDLYISVPSFFKCPISLDVMKSPVSLCTGVTYDRTSIQRWLDTGNNTCPATMQVLQTKDFVPNFTLQRLIQIWSNNQFSLSFDQPLQTQAQLKQFNSISCSFVSDLIKQIIDKEHKKYQCVKTKSAFLFDGLVKILCFASETPSNGRFLASKGEFIEYLTRVICSLQEGPGCVNPDFLETVLKLLYIILPSTDGKTRKKFSSCDLVCILTQVIKTGRSGAQVEAAGIIETFARDDDLKKIVLDQQELVYELLCVLKQEEKKLSTSGDEREIRIDVIRAVLSCLISISSTRTNKKKLVRAGGVKIIREIMVSSSPYNNNTNKYSVVINELLLTLLESLVGSTEGRNAISNEQYIVPMIINKLMKVSKVANQHAIALLWSLCYLFRDQRVKDGVIRSNGGLTKILLLMQSDCSPAVKNMCCDLLRIFRVNSKSCLSSYDTKTTHIMPC